MPVVRALPTDEFDVHGLNAEMRWEIMCPLASKIP
jgi:hypothetical protein